MANTKAVVKRTGRTWSVFQGKELIEGGFFSREAAVVTADELNSERDVRAQEDK
jgi:hypothetical protein